MADAVPESEKFKKSRRITAKSAPLSLTGALPGERAAKGDVINERVTVKDSDPSHTPRQIELKTKLAEGGEGSVYTTSLGGGFVAKIYRRDRLTSDRKSKIELMISKRIDCPGICFPEAIVLNSNGEFVGYLMREARGYELGKSVFQPKLFLQKFKNWTKKDTIQLCITILQKIKYLNDRNVILGDINPANILVVSPKEVYFVDCDSYQVEGYPCPVGTVNFTPPEAQQWKDYKTNLRTQEMENFAIATLLFMIMLPGKPPYSAVGGESQSKNIINGDFPYPLTEDTNKTPPGKWGFIWSHMSYKTKEAFFQTFKRGEKHFQPTKRLSADEWAKVFETYHHSVSNMVKNDPMSNNIFPTRKKGEYIVEHRICASCHQKFGITKNRLDWEQRKSQQEGSSVRIEVCDTCKENKQRGGSGGAYSKKTTGRQKASARYRTPTNSSASRQPATARQSKIVGSGSVRQSTHTSTTGGKAKQGQQTTNTSSTSNAKKIVWIVVAAVFALLFFFAVSTCSDRNAGYSTGSSNSSAQTYQVYRSSLDKKTDEKLAQEDAIAKFGSYPTTADGKAEPIYWRLLSLTDDSMIFYSAFVLDGMAFNDAEGECSWNDSSIKAWLNNEFLNTAFTEEERAQLVPVDGEDSDALISLVSVEQAKGCDSDLALYATPYAQKQGVAATWRITNNKNEVVKDGCAEWWLRNDETNDWAPIIAGMWSPDEKGRYYEERPAASVSGVVPVIKVDVNSS